MFFKKTCKNIIEIFVIFDNYLFLEFKTFAEGQLDYFRKWKESESEMHKMQEKISKLEADKRRLETQIKSLK